MPRAVRLSSYGPVENLELVEVAVPTAGAGEIVVRVHASGTNPGEIKIREGLLQQIFPFTLPSGQGSDFAGVVESIGAGVMEFAPGDEVIGTSDTRAAQADYVVARSAQLVRKPAPLDWMRAGALNVVGKTAFAAVRAVDLKAGDVVAVSNAAGGVGSLAIQLARRSGARVLAITGPANAEFVRSLGVEPVAYGDGLEQRLRGAAPKLDAFIDLYGDEYVELAVRLGVEPQRIDTIAGFAAAQKHGTKAEGGAAADASVLATVAELIAFGEVVMPIAAIYPFGDVHDAYRELARGHTRGKIVLSMEPDARRERPRAAAATSSP